MGFFFVIDYCVKFLIFYRILAWYLKFFFLEPNQSVSALFFSENEDFKVYILLSVTQWVNYFRNENICFSKYKKVTVNHCSMKKGELFL